MNLAIGTVQFGIKYGISNQKGLVDFKEQKKILNFAKKVGIDTLDTAISYGDSESNLGKHGVNNFKLITKIPIIPDSLINVTEWIETNVSSSIQKLSLKSLYGLLLHRSSDLFKYNGEVIRCLKDLKKLGVVKKIGISIYSPDELENIPDLNMIDIVQAPFSILDRRLETTGWLNKLDSLNIEIHVRSIFLQGLLLLPKKKISEKFLRWQKLWDKWHDWQTNNPKVSPLNACLRFVSEPKQINRIVIGVESLNQIEQIVVAKKNLNSIDLPNISCEDKELLNPSNWKNL